MGLGPVSLFGPYEKGHKMKLCQDWYRNGVDPSKFLWGFFLLLFRSRMWTTDIDRPKHHVFPPLDLPHSLGFHRVEFPFLFPPHYCLHCRVREGAV